MSEHVIKVVPIKLEPHTNSDSLSIVRIDGWTCVVKTESWKDKKLGIYIPPDYMVDTNRPEFAWLKKSGHNSLHRVRVQKLRGVISQGFLVPAPDDAVIGDDYMQCFGILRYEPEHQGMSTGGQTTKGPEFYVPKYEVENYYSYPELLNNGEEVLITEKLHGSGGKFTFAAGKMFCGSRNEWKLEDPTNLWWRCLKDNPWIGEFCKVYPEHVLYGELLGVQGGFPYGARGNVPFRAFDVLYKGQWLAFDEAILLVTLKEGCQEIDENRWVPILYRGPFNKDKAIELAEGNTTISGANHIREGIVIQPLPDSIDPKIGRVKLKIVSNIYMEKS